MLSLVRLALVTGLISLTAAHAALAQDATVAGTVRDATGVIAGATVTLRDPAGGTREVATDRSGQFRFAGLRPGAYEIVVFHRGFAPATRTLTVDAGPRTVDVTLEVAGLFTTVDVSDVAERGTASGMDVPNSHVPNYVVSVPASTLREQGINDLASALENVSGVITQVQYGVYEWYTIGGITQQSGNDFLYVDGMALTGNRSATQLNNVEEIQVLKGPNSLLYGGSGAGQGGMVNVIRKKPSAVPSHDVLYRVGPHGLQEFTGATAGPLFGAGRLLYRLDASFSDQDGWRNNARRRLNVSPSLTLLLSPRMRITTNQAFVRDRYRLDAGLRRELVDRPGVPFDRSMNPRGDFQLTRDWQNQIVYTWELTDRLKLTNNFFTRRNRDQYLDAESMGYNAALDQVTRSYLYFQHNRRPVQNQLQVEGDYTLWGMQHRPMVRYEFLNHYSTTNRTGNAPGASNALHMPLPPVPVEEFIAGTWQDPAPRYTEFPLTRVDHSTNRNHVAVLQDVFYPVRWLAVNAAMRRGTHRRTTSQDHYDNGVLIQEGMEARIRNNTRSNYRIGAVLLPQDSWPRVLRGAQPYFSRNTSFNPVNSIQPDGSPLDPVVNESWEVGNRWSGLQSRLTVQAAVRRIQDRNRLVSLGEGWFEQIGKATTHNADLDVQGYVGGGVSVLAAWGWAESRIDPTRSDGQPQANANRRFPHAPKQTARLSVAKAFRLRPDTGLTVRLGGRHVSWYFTNSANTITMPERTTFDGTVSLRHGRYDVNLNLGNLTNRRRYFTSQINGGNLLYPGEPFNATLTVGYRFR